MCDNKECWYYCNITLFTRLSSPNVDRSNLLRSHAAKSAECSSQSSPKARRVPRESRRVSLAQASGYVQLNQYRLLEPIGQVSYGCVSVSACHAWTKIILKIITNVSCILDSQNKLLIPKV